MNKQQYNYSSKERENRNFLDESPPLSQYRRVDYPSYNKAGGKRDHLVHSEESNGQIIDDNIDINAPVDDENENAIEYIIMNLYSKMKNLESKYIDLANYYKQELVKNNVYNPQQKKFSSSINSGGFLQQNNETDTFNNKPGEQAYGQLAESDIIQDLIEEKKKLEEDMKQMINAQPPIAVRSYQQSHFASPSKQRAPSKEEQSMLQEALTNFIDGLDILQIEQMKYLTGKQNDMYSLTLKHNFPANARNESLGLWADAKTKMGTLILELKNRQLKQKDKFKGSGGADVHQQEDNAYQTLSDRGHMNKTGINFDQMDKQIQVFKRKAEQQKHIVQNLKHSLRYKDQLLKDESNKLSMLINDLSNALIDQIQSNSYKKSQLFSNEKNNPSNQGPMSPFEKRIANYQKSAEMRKAPQDTSVRSGSNNRSKQYPPQYNTGTNFYPSSQQHEDQIIKNKLNTVQQVFEELCVKMQRKDVEQGELEKIAEAILQDYCVLIQEHDQLSRNAKSGKQNSGQTMMSPNSRQVVQETKLSSFDRQDQQSKIQELQKNNDSLFIELRKANEKYLNQRVENNRLSDEIQILQANIQSQNRYDSKTQQQAHTMSKTQRQHDKYSGSQPPAGDTTSLLVRENEELKKRVREFEQATPITLKGLQQESIDQKIKIESTCLLIQKFLLAMKRLQRAVNSKSKDVQQFKTDFETSKKELEKVSQENKLEDVQKLRQQQNALSQGSAHSQGQNPNSYSMVMPKHPSQKYDEDGEDADNVQHTVDEQKPPKQRNRSQAPSSSYQVKQAFPGLSQRQQQQYMQSQYQQQEEIKESSQQQQHQYQSKPIIIAKQNPTNQYTKGGRYDQNDDSLKHSKGGFELSGNSQSHFKTIDLEEQQVKEEVRLLNIETDILKKNNSALQVQVEELNKEKLANEIKYISKSNNFRKLQGQFKRQAEKLQAFEKLTIDYKDSLETLEKHQDLSKKLVNKTRMDLVIRERELFTNQTAFDAPLSSDRSDRQVPSARAAQEQAHQHQLEKLRHELQQIISIKEGALTIELQELQKRLELKEKDLENLRQLFFKQLKEIENSFVELSQEMEDNGNIMQQQIPALLMGRKQQISAKEYQSQPMPSSGYQTQQMLELERSVEHVVGKLEEDQREEELESLLQANEELRAENDNLRDKIKDLEVHKNAQQANKQLEAQIKDKDQTITNMVKNVKELQISLQKEQDTVKRERIDRKNAQNSANEMELKLNKQNLEWQQRSMQMQQELQASDDRYQEQVEKFGMKLSEIKELNKNILNIQKEVDAQKEAAMLEREAQQELQVQIENLLKENIGLQEELNQLQHQDESKLESLDSITEDDLQLIQAHPKKAADKFYRQFKATEKEFTLLSQDKEKLDEKFQDIKEKLETQKQKVRGSLEKLMALESKNLELSTENDKMFKELDKCKTAIMKADEEQIRKQIEEEYKDKLNYQIAETELMAGKSSKIANINVELAAKCQRLEVSNNELTIETDQQRNKIGSLEMELEMTKINGETETQQLLQMEREKEEQKRRNIELKAKLSQEEITLKLNKKKAKLQDIKKKNEELAAQGLTNMLTQKMADGLKTKLEQLQKDMEAKEAALKQKEAEKQKTESQLLTEKEHKQQIINEMNQQAQLLDIQAKELKKHENLLQQEQEQKQALLQQTEIEKQAIAKKKEAELLAKLHNETELMQKDKNYIVQQLNQEKEEQLKQLKSEHDAEIRSINDKASKDIQEKENLLKDLKVKYEKEKHDLTVKLNDMKSQHLQETEQMMNELSIKRDELEQDWETQKQNEIKQLQNQLTNKHTLELGQLKSTNEKELQKLQKLKADLESKLEQVKEDYELQLQDVNDDLMQGVEESKNKDQRIKQLDDEKDLLDKQKQYAISDLRKQLQDAETKHIHEVQELEAQIQAEREARHSKLLESEKQNIERMRQEHQTEKAKILESKQDEIKQLKDWQNVVIAEKEAENQKAREQHLKELQEKLHKEKEEALKKKEAEMTLGMKMQAKIKDDLAKKLEEEEKKQHEKEIQFQASMHDLTTKISAKEQDLVHMKGTAEKEAREQDMVIEGLKSKLTKALDEQKQMFAAKEALALELLSIKQSYDTKHNQSSDENQQLQRDLLQIKTMMQTNDNEFKKEKDHLHKQVKDLETEKIKNTNLVEFNKTKLAESTKEAEDFKQRFTGAESKQKELLYKLNELEREKAEVQKGLSASKDQLQVQLQALTKEKSDIQHQVQELNQKHAEQVQTLNNQINKIKEDNQTQQAKERQDQKQAIADKEQLISKLQKDIEKAHKENDSKDVEINNLEKDLDDLGKEMQDQSDHNLQQQQENLHKLNEQISKLQQDKTSLTKEKGESTMSLKLKEAMVQKIQDEIKEKSQELEMEQKHNVEVQKLKEAEIQRLKDQIKAKDLQVQQLTQKVTDVTVQVSDKERELVEGIEKQKKLSKATLDKEITQLKIQYDKIKDDQKKQCDEETLEAINHANQQEQTFIKQVADLNSQVQSLQKQRKQMMEESKLSARHEDDKNQKQIQQLREEIDSLQSQNKQFDLQVKQKEQDLKQKDQQVKTKEQDLKTKEHDLQQKVQELTSDNQVKDTEIKQKDLEIKRKDTELKQKIEELKSKVQDIALKDHDIQAKDAELKQKDADIKKKDSDIKQKLEEAKQKQSELAHKDQEIHTKDEQLKQKETDIKQKDSEIKQKDIELKQKLEELKQKDHDFKTKEAEVKQKEDQILQKQKSASKKQDLNKSIDEIERKLGEFDIGLKQVKSDSEKLRKDRSRQKELLSDSLLKLAEEEKLEADSPDLKFCKRIKYMDKAWILLKKSQTYYWINQERLSPEKFKALDTAALTEGDIQTQQELLSNRLSELAKERDEITKGLEAGGKIVLSGKRDKELALELENLKNTYADLQYQNNALQTANLQQKSKISELNDIIYGIKDVDKSNENIKKFLDLNNKYEEKCQLLLTEVEKNRKLKNELESKSIEVEQLKRQSQESHLSFNSKQANSLGKIENFPLDNSSIIDIKLGDEKGEDDQKLKDRISQLEGEIKDLQKQNTLLESQLKTLKTENADLIRDKQSHTAAAQESEAVQSLLQAKSLLIKYLEKVAVSSPENEAYLKIVFAMMQFTKDEISKLTAVRTDATKAKVVESTKKGLMGAMFGKK